MQEESIAKEPESRTVTAEALAAVLAHDLGNLITPIRGRVDLIRRRAAREGRERDLEDAAEAIRALERMQRLIADLVDAGRLEEGLLTIVRQPVDCAAQARAVAEQAGTPSIEVRVDGAETLMLQADGARLRRALEHLVANAVRHSPPDRPVVVELRDDGEWAEIVVRDEGPGIAPDVLPGLFERFRTGPGSRGLGLGLYLARGIAEAHGGSLTGRSMPGRGSAFCLSLPIVSDHDSG